LLDPAVWQESLEKYALATNLAVALADADGRLLGQCINLRPTRVRSTSCHPDRATASPTR
jgi:hypothetical protein